MAPVNGIFSETGTSAEVAGSKVSIRLRFAGAASVDIEERMYDGNWIKVETGLDGDASLVFDSPTISTLRLNCTAHTNDVSYTLETN